MDWVEATGKSVDEATSRAIAHLGIGVEDAEIEVLEEPRTGLFGRVKGEARVRARVRPKSPRPKRTRRDHERREGKEGSKSHRGGGKPREEGPAAEPTDADAARSTTSSSGPRSSKSRKRQSSSNSSRSAADGVDERRGAQSPMERSRKASPEKKKEGDVANGVSLSEQAEAAKGFLEGLLQSMNLQATVTWREVDDETVELSIDADPPSELGVLVGSRGATLSALQELTRTFVQIKSTGRTDRILVDVARYRERRVAALGRFAQQVAEEVVRTGEERALEPMSAADRKAVHDALATNDLVQTRSEGEDPQRFIVISPA
ncbi:MAG: RNA-binding cell elongation regulator Jag/EloR [Acidimicrobiales bacterium]